MATDFNRALPAKESLAIWDSGTEHGALTVYNGDPNSNVTGSIGALCIDYSGSGKLWKNTDGSTTWVDISSGASEAYAPINYITNFGAESSITGWSTYIDAAGTKPVDGTGGGATSISVTRTTSSPLRSTASGLITKPGTNCQGEGVSYDFTIDAADKGKVLSVSFDYITASGTFNAGSSTADSDITIWLYDVTNSRLIQPTEYKLYSNSSTNPFSYVGTFQASPDSTSYRVIMHIGVSTTNSFTFKFDNVVVGPMLKTVTSAVSGLTMFPSVAAGTLITATTTSPTYGTIDQNVAFYLRTGPMMQIHWTFRQSTAGSAGSGSYLFNLPAGYSVDTSLYPASTSIFKSGCGTFSVSNSSGSSGFGRVYVYSATQLWVEIEYYSGGAGQGIWGSGLFQFNDDDTFILDASVPIAGWGSNVELNSMDSNRPVHARYTGTVSANSSTSNPVQWGTKDYDTHNAVTTGSSWKFTAPSAGYYSVKCSFAGGSTAVYPVLFKNGVQNSNIGNETSLQEWVIGATEIYLSAGDYIDIRCTNSNTIIALTYAVITISKLDSATQIGANETVAASYYCSAGQSNSSSTPINFDTKIDDTHNAVTTGTWKFTAPVSGIYKVGGAHNSASGTGFYIQLYKNGSLYLGHCGYVDVYGTTTYCAQVKLLAGDYIDLRGSASNTANGGNLTDGVCRIEINRIN